MSPSIQLGNSVIAKKPAPLNPDITNCAPVDFPELVFELDGRHPKGVQRCNSSSGTGTGYQVWFDTGFLQCFQHPNVGISKYGSTTESQAEPGATTTNTVHGKRPGMALGLCHPDCVTAIIQRVIEIVVRPDGAGTK